MWSDTAYATTTEATNMAPGVPTAVMTEAMSDTHIRGVLDWRRTRTAVAPSPGYEVEYTA